MPDDPALDDSALLSVVWSVSDVWPVCGPVSEVVTPVVVVAAGVLSASSEVQAKHVLKTRIVVAPRIRQRGDSGGARCRPGREIGAASADLGWREGVGAIVDGVVMPTRFRVGRIRSRENRGIWETASVASLLEPRRRLRAKLRICTGTLPIGDRPCDAYAHRGIGAAVEQRAC